MVRWETIPTVGLHPNFQVQSNVYYPEYLSIPVSAENLERLCHKIVRGITYIIDEAFIGENYKIHFFTVEDKSVQSILDDLKKNLKTYERPGIKVIRAMTTKNKITGFYAVEIWGKLKMYAIVKSD